MKKHTLAAWAAATLLLLSACTGSGENHTTPPAVQPEDQTQGDTLPSDGEGEEFPVYYGTWTVTGVQAYCALSALGPEEAEAKVGSTVPTAPPPLMRRGRRAAKARCTPRLSPLPRRWQRSFR